MKTLPEPSFGVREVLESCAGSLRDVELATRLRSEITTVESAENEYRHLGSMARLFEIGATEEGVGLVKTAEMVNLYKGTLSRKVSSSRHYYDSLKLAAQNDICPFCGQRVVKTLDHYLPKTKHPALAITPLNLVPSCSDCNKLKLDREASSAGDQTLHPYFDNVGGETWLVAELRESTPPAVIYKASPPLTWDVVLQQRLIAHFQTFGLGELYAAQAGAEMVSIRYALADAAEAGGADGVRSFLDHQARTRARSDPNSWVAALYSALSASAWFCSGGFKSLG